MLSTAGTAGNADYSDVVSVFEPASGTMPALRPYVAECWQRRRFSIELARAQLKGQRSSTAAGELWALIDPAFQAAIYVFLFTVIRGGAGSATSYITVIIFGVFMFSYTRAGIAEAGRSIRRNQGLVLNSVFPRALLPLGEVYKGFLELMPALGIYGLVHLALRAPIGAGIFMLPLLIAVQTVMNVGLGLLFATWTVLIRDMSNLINYVVRALTFLTPVVYPIWALSPGLRQILSFNPLYPLFACYQAIVIGATPTGGMVFASIAWALVFLALGTWMFLRHERSFALHL